MASLLITKETGGYFSFVVDGNTADKVTNMRNDVFAIGNILHFKTATGANIIKTQNINVTDITLIASGTFTFSTVPSFLAKLIDVGYYDWLLGGGLGSGATRFDALLDTFQYFGKAGQVVIVAANEIGLETVVLHNVSKATELTDMPTSILPNKLLVGNALGTAIEWQDKPIVIPPSLTSVGSFHYVDLATKTTPLTVLAGVEKLITNDTLDTTTNLLNAPYGISSMWNTTTNQLDFSQTDIGDLVTVIPAIEITTTAINQTFQIYIKTGIGSATPLTKQVYNGALAVIGTIIVNPTKDFTVDALLKDYPAEIYILSSANSTVKSGALDIKVVRKNINLINVEVDGIILKLDKGTYTGTAQDLDTRIDVLESQTDVSNVFVTMTGYSFLANVLTINAAWFWKLLGILYTNATSVNETIPYCAAGKTRIDYVVPNNTNGFTRISGPETLGTAIAPQIPANGLYVTYFIVTDSSIGVPKNPNVNNIPDLQKVLETGYATKEIIWFYNETDSRCLGLNSERIMFQKNESIFNIIDSSLTTESYTVKLPNKTGGADETFAMVSDVSTSLASANSYTDGKVAGLYKVKGSVANYAALPSTGQVVGDVWNLTDTGANYVWTGTVWDELGTTVNLSGLAPIASPTFTGTPTAPTATVGTNTTQLATTAFVLANAGEASPITLVNTNTLATTSLLSGPLNSTASSAIFIGINAGKGTLNGTTGAILIGNIAGLNAYNSPYMVCIGDSAGQAQYNSGRATVIGNSAGVSAFDTASSVMIGEAAGYGARGSKYSILIGAKAGMLYVADSNRIGQNCIIIGLNISLPPLTTNALNIGGVIFGTGIHSTYTGNPLTTPMVGAKIGIGVVNPSATFEVNGDIKALTYTGTRVTASITGTYNIDWNAGDTFVLTVTGNVTISNTNLPTGTNTKTIEVEIKGNFAVTLPTTWTALPSTQTYSTTKWNHYVVSCINGTTASENIKYANEVEAV